jgi:hypothetical protein
VATTRPNKRPKVRRNAIVFFGPSDSRWAGATTSNRDCAETRSRLSWSSAFFSFSKQLHGAFFGARELLESHLHLRQRHHDLANFRQAFLGVRQVASRRIELSLERLDLVTERLKTDVSLAIEIVGLRRHLVADEPLDALLLLEQRDHVRMSIGQALRVGGAQLLVHLRQ